MKQTDLILTKKEMQIILIVRSFADAVLDITIMHSQPVFCKLNYTGLRSRYAVPKAHPLTGKEYDVMEFLRTLKFGKLIILIKDGSIEAIDSSSTATIKLDGDIANTF